MGISENSISENLKSGVLHDLSMNENYLKNLINGSKKADIIFNDRDFQVGDCIRYRQIEYNETHFYYFKITHIHSGYGLKNGYICVSLEMAI